MHEFFHADRLDQTGEFPAFGIGKIENDVRNTKEFLKVMDNSPELTAVDLNAPYKKLLEYRQCHSVGTIPHFV